MPQVIVPIASGSDDGFVYRDGSTSYPPSTGTATDNASTFADTSREWTAGGLFRLFNTLLRFDTGAQLPDGATIDSVSLSVDVMFISNVDGRNLTADYYAWDGTAADYSQTAQTGAITAYSLSGVTTGLNSIPFNGFSGISTTGITSVRLHVDGGQPTGRNIMEIATFEDATLQEPRLIIDYTLEPGAGPGNAYIQIGDDGDRLGKKKRTQVFAI